MNDNTQAHKTHSRTSKAIARGSECRAMGVCMADVLLFAKSYPHAHNRLRNLEPLHAWAGRASARPDVSHPGGLLAPARGRPRKRSSARTAAYAASASAIDPLVLRDVKESAPGAGYGACSRVVGLSGSATVKTSSQ